MASLAPPFDARERHRRRIVVLVVIVYVLLLCEGALRKWVAPSLGQALFFVRDPFVLATYLYALAGPHPVRGRWVLVAGIALGIVGVLAVALQAMAGTGFDGTRLLLAAYGWRNYFLYVPLVVVIANAFRPEDVARVVRLTLWIALPVAPLVAAQFFAAPDSPLNVGIASDVAQQFRGLMLVGERTRPTGLFTSDVGQKLFVVTTLAMVLALWIAPRRERPVAGWLLLAATGAALTALAFGGSRGAVIHAGIVVLAALASASALRGGAARALLLPVGLVLVAVIAYPIVFPEGFEAFTGRWAAAAAAESRSFQFGVFGRALYGFVDFVDIAARAPVLGYGLGLAGNASLTLGVRIEGFDGWAETDWARNVVDLGPVFGLAWIAFRIALVAWLASQAFRSARATGSALPLTLFAVAGVELLNGQITGHGTVNGFAWLFAGFALAAGTPPQGAPDGAPGLAAARFPNLLR